MHIAGSDNTIGILARELAQVLGRVVLNQTGLSDRYDLSLRWTPVDAAALSPSSPDVPSGIFTAIQEQLGFKCSERLTAYGEVSTGQGRRGAGCFRPNLPIAHKPPATLSMSDLAFHEKAGRCQVI